MDGTFARPAETFTRRLWEFEQRTLDGARQLFDAWFLGSSMVHMRFKEVLYVENPVAVPGLGAAALGPMVGDQVQLQEQHAPLDHTV